MYQGSGGAPPAAQGFAAHPRVVHQKPKFKDPYGVAPVQQDEYYPQNIMYDKRVQRGSTYAAMVLPAGNYPDTLFDNRKERAKAKAQARAAACEEFFTRDQRTPEPLQGRQNIDIQTDQFVEELTDKAPCYEIGCQTEIKIERPQTPRFMPKKVGCDKKTLVEDNELFEFEADVEPILSVLCGKTLEIARMEVLEEEELREMKEQQEHYQRMNHADTQEIERMEQTEKKRLADFEKLKQSHREKKKNRQLAHRKIVARQISKSYLGGLKENVVKKLAATGFYTNSFKIDVLDSDVVPWLHDRAFEFLQDLHVQESMPTALLNELAQTEKSSHMRTVQAEKERKETVRLEAERLEAEKQEQKRKRREEKERAKKAAERDALRGEIDTQFIEPGETKVPILEQEIVEIDGMGEKGKQVIGALGGMLGQLIIVLSIMERNFNRQLTSKSQKSKRSSRSRKSADKSKAQSGAESGKEDRALSQKSGKSDAEEEKKSEAPVSEKKDIDYSVEPTYVEKGWFDRARVQQFLQTYIGEKLRTPQMQLVVGHSYEKFISSLPQPLPMNQTRKNMRDEAYKTLRELLRTPARFGDPVFKVLAKNCEELGIQQNVFNLVYEGFWDLYFKRPHASTGLNSKKLEGWINNINLSVPPFADSGEDNEKKDGEDDGPEDVPAGDARPQVKAAVRIRIPFEQPKQADQDADADDVDAKSQRSRRSQAESRRSKNKEPESKKEIDWEDRVKAVASLIDGADYQVYVVHQLPQRLLREHIAKEFKMFLDKELDAVAEEELLATVENQAEQIEEAFFKLNDPEMPVFDFEIN